MHLTLVCWECCQIKITSCSTTSLSLASHHLLYRVRIQLNNRGNSFCLQNHWSVYCVFHKVLWGASFLLGRIEKYLYWGVLGWLTATKTMKKGKQILPKVPKDSALRKKIPGCPAAPERTATTSEEEAVSQVTRDISMRDSASTLFTKALKTDVWGSYSYTCIWQNFPISFHIVFTFLTICG